ncbi:helix-turn-helix domain-containing protein, partial [Streptomyces sp. NRRL F-2664]|uniref:helix-turn-helix domain-containing protein n=1 Tax=Streptomyces sp. NRRL F-2664 TaxID=1463842 RepID=UPI0018FE0519
MSFKPSSVASDSVIPPLTRPQLAEARSVRAAELFGQGRSSAEIAWMLEVSDESVRRWKRVWEEGGTGALRRRPAAGRRPSWTTARSSRCGPLWSEVPGRTGSRLICGRWSGSVWWGEQSHREDGLAPFIDVEGRAGGNQRGVAQAGE